MKYTKRLLISMSFFAFLLTVSGCTNEEEIGGGSKEHPAIQTIRATKSDFITTQEVDVPLTRTTIDGYKTTFNSGDKIGLFAIKDGAIVDNVNNIALTCTVTTDDTNSSTNWTLPTDTKIYYYEGVTYIAYYPYNKNVTIDASKTKDEIIKSLVDNSYLQPKDDQSATDGSGYTASDLMIATANANASDILNVSLSLEFKHQFSLLVMTPMIYTNSIYPPPNNAGFTYCVTPKASGVDTQAKNATLSGVKSFKMSDGSFRAIVNTTMIAKGLSVDYESEKGKFVHYQGTDISKLGKGEYYTLTVKNTILSNDAKERPLAPGDFVFHGDKGIEIYPYDGELTDGKIPNCSNAVGIVVTCDEGRMTDSICNAKGWNHAYVIGFVTDADVHSWGRKGTNIDNITDCTTDNGASYMNGYTDSEKILALENHEHYIFYLSLKDKIRNSYSVPESLKSSRSDWFIPSVGQYYDLLNNLCGKSPDNFESKTDNKSWTETTNAGTMYSCLQSHYTKLGKLLLLSGSFWASSEYDANNAWYLNFTNNKIELGIEDKGTSDNMYIYAFFAF